MSTGLVETIKKASIAANNAEQPCDLRYGTVVEVSPLTVRITNQFTLPSSLLIVPQHLTDYELSVTLTTPSETEDEKNESDEPEVGEQVLKVFNALKVGDRVALLRKRGGQSYFILDRI